MSPAVLKTLISSNTKKRSYGGAINVQPKVSNTTYVVVFVIVLVVLVYFFGRKSEKKVSSGKSKGKDATITSSQAANYANSLETYLSSGSQTTSSELNRAFDIIESLSDADLLAVANSYSQTDYRYDTLRAALNAQYMWHRSSSINQRMRTAISKLSSAGI